MPFMPSRGGRPTVLLWGADPSGAGAVYILEMNTPAFDPRPFRAAFRALSGAIYTGLHHFDAMMLAADAGEFSHLAAGDRDSLFARIEADAVLADRLTAQLWDEGGYVGKDSRFYTREEAAAIAGRPGEKLDSHEWADVNGRTAVVA